METCEFRNWEIAISKGKCNDFTHDVLAITITSKIINASRTFLFNDFNLEFNKKVKPFMALVGVLDSDLEVELRALASKMVKDNQIVEVDSIDELLEISFSVSDEDVRLYCKNISDFVGGNDDLFAIKGDKASSDDNDKIFEPKYHFGAWLQNEQYITKFSNDALALCIDKFKKIADIDLDKHTVKDVVKKFISNGCILCGAGSSTVDKDLTLSRGNEVRCYVLDMKKINEVAGGSK